jgi:hypothetical protein
MEEREFEDTQRSLVQPQGTTRLADPVLIRQPVHASVFEIKACPKARQITEPTSGLSKRKGWLRCGGLGFLRASLKANSRRHKNREAFMEEWSGNETLPCIFNFVCTLVRKLKVAELYTL